MITCLLGYAYLLTPKGMAEIEALSEETMTPRNSSVKRPAKFA